MHRRGGEVAWREQKELGEQGAALETVPVLEWVGSRCRFVQRSWKAHLQISRWANGGKTPEDGARTERILLSVWSEKTALMGNMVSSFQAKPLHSPLGPYSVSPSLGHIELGSARLPEDLHCSVVHSRTQEASFLGREWRSQASAPRALPPPQTRLTQPVSLLTCCPPGPAGVGEVGGVAGGGDRMLLGSWERAGTPRPDGYRVARGKGVAQVTPPALRRTRPPQACEPGRPGSLWAHARAHAARSGLPSCPPGAGEQSPESARPGRWPAAG